LPEAQSLNFPAEAPVPSRPHGRDPSPDRRTWDVVRAASSGIRDG